jgi:hypothetical protein
MAEGQICMKTSHFYLFIFVGLAIIAWALYQVNQQSIQMVLMDKERACSLDMINENLDEMIDQRIRKTESSMSNMHEQHSKLIDMLVAANEVQRDQDIRRMADPMVPPVRRGPYSPLIAEKTLPVNVPTRGEYGNFQTVGYAYKPNNPDQMFQLFGRRIHSNKYEYYVVHPITQIKIPIRTKNDWELYKDDKVTVKGFPGDFKVEIYDLDQPRYVPY